MASDPEAKPRGLWEVMKQSPETAAPAESESSEPEFEENVSADSPAESSEKPGLWSMMGVEPPPAVESVSPDETEPAPPPEWFRKKPPAEDDAEAPEPPALQPQETLAEFLQDVPDEPPAQDPEIEVPPVPALVVDERETPAHSKRAAIRAKSGRSRGAMYSFLVGLFALPLTLLATRPEIWTRIPATVLGFGAMVIGLIAFNEIQRSRGEQTGTRLAIMGMIFGTIAMFLGPLVIAPWSARQDRAGVRQITKDHLVKMGSAILQYHRKYDRFPPGGTYRVEPSGDSTALHSWMTSLLPFLEAQAIYQDIHQNEPWNDPLNKRPLSKSVTAFLAGGVEMTHNKRGYGVSHFAGLGGQDRTSTGKTASVGIFDRSSYVTRSDLHDGASQTLIAGEIPEGYRPWGEPGNWRTIGDGLNKDTTSFGNANQTGALFLKADGSVQFYSNQVSADVLRRLSTRDGEDNRMIPDKYR